MPRLTAPTVPPGTLADRPQPRLEGVGIALRPFRPEDREAIVAVYSDPEIHQWHGQALTLPEAARWIDDRTAGWSAERSAEWAVEIDGRLAGRMGLRTLDLHDGCGEVAYWTAAAHRGRGVARAGLTLVTAWALDLGLVRIELMHSVRNPGSCAVATANGYILEGVKRLGALHPDGWHDMHLHARVRAQTTTEVADRVSRRAQPPGAGSAPRPH